MPCYRVYRIKESQKEHFRWSAHTGGLAIVKQRDYELGGEVESLTPYSLWKELQDSRSSHLESPLCPGDVLETVESGQPGQLFIAKYIGFEPAQWFVAEVRASTPQESLTEDKPTSEPEKALLS